MANPLEPHWSEERRHVDDGGEIGSEEYIKQQIRSDFNSLGQVVESLDDIPVGGEVRSNGIFTDPKDAEQWLADGGLTLHDEDGSNIPVPWVYLIVTTDEFGNEEFTVFISDDSNVA